MEDYFLAQQFFYISVFLNYYIKLSLEHVEVNEMFRKYIHIQLIIFQNRVSSNSPSKLNILKSAIYCFVFEKSPVFNKFVTIYSCYFYKEKKVFETSLKEVVSR